MKKMLLSLGILFLVGSMAGNRSWSSDEKKERFVVDFFTGGVDEKGIPKGWVQEKEPGAQSKIAVGQEKEFHFVNLLSVTTVLESRRNFLSTSANTPISPGDGKPPGFPRAGTSASARPTTRRGRFTFSSPIFPP